MELSTRGYDEEYTADSSALKFVVVDDSDKRQLIVSSVVCGLQHHELIPDNTHLIGGGKIMNYGYAQQVFWNSPSCIEKHGYDRPLDTAEAAQVLMEVKKNIKEWMQKVL
ncbi:hypothetical protein GF354_01920 [Candidatus Peregrinibacteria bacterium]|nr:hypothetical protein [Candidatus Peregrinibacteria bacterium]